MFDYSSFTAINPVVKSFGEFTAEELSASQKNLPDEISYFLGQEGQCSFHNGFLWTTLPSVFHDRLSEWGLKGHNCHAFLRTALGACVYYSKKNYFYLDPILGRIVSLNDDLELVMNVYLTMDAILDHGFFRNYWIENKDKKSIGYDEVHALVPALPLGGSLETSRLEVVKMREHLAFLAQLFGNKARKI